MIVVLLAVCLAFAAWSDWKRRKISNWLLFPMMATGLLYQLWTGQGLMALGGLTGGFVLTVVPVVLRAMGMGDQKLLMAAGVWLGFAEIYWLFLVSALLCVGSMLFMPQRLGLLGRHLFTLAAGWRGHRKLWFPSYQQSAWSIPFAVFFFAAFLIRYGRWMPL